MQLTRCGLLPVSWALPPGQLLSGIFSQNAAVRRLVSIRIGAVKPAPLKHSIVGDVSRFKVHEDALLIVTRANFEWLRTHVLTGTALESCALPID